MLLRDALGHKTKQKNGRIYGVPLLSSDALPIEELQWSYSRLVSESLPVMPLCHDTQSRRPENYLSCN